MLLLQWVHSVFDAYCMVERLQFFTHEAIQSCLGRQHRQDFLPPAARTCGFGVWSDTCSCGKQRLTLAVRPSGCFCTLGVPFLGVLRNRARLFGVFIGPLSFGHS